MNTTIAKRGIAACVILAVLVSMLSCSVYAKKDGIYKVSDEYLDIRMEKKVETKETRKITVSVCQGAINMMWEAYVKYPKKKEFTKKEKANTISKASKNYAAKYPNKVYATVNLKRITSKGVENIGTKKITCTIKTIPNYVSWKDNAGRHKNLSELQTYGVYWPDTKVTFAGLKKGTYKLFLTYSCSKEKKPHTYNDKWSAVYKVDKNGNVTPA